jgi:glucokinase
MSLLGIDLGGTNVRAGRVNGNSIVNIVTSKISSSEHQNVVLDELRAAIDRVIDADVTGIGVGVPSVVDTEKGIIYDVQNIPSWKEVHLKKFLEEKYRIPVCVNNDANCFVVGEKYFGKAKGFSDVVGLIIGTGLGAGLIVNGKLYSGRNCGAGEFGMIPYKGHNYEHYGSGQFFIQEHNTDGAALFTAAQKNDLNAKKIFMEFGAHLGEAIKMIMYAVDPQIIILGGSLIKSFDYFQEAMWASVKMFEYKRSLQNFRIDCSDVTDIAVLGAAALFLDATGGE